MVDKIKKENIVKDFGVHGKDTGSVEVQIALLTARIKDLHNHFSAFPKDVASKKGLMQMVNRRRNFLDYLHHRNVEKYEEIISRLELRK